VRARFRARSSRYGLPAIARSHLYMIGRSNDPLSDRSSVQTVLPRSPVSQPPLGPTSSFESTHESSTPVVPSPTESRWMAMPKSYGLHYRPVDVTLFTGVMSSDLIGDILDAYFSFSKTSTIPGPFATIAYRVVRRQLEEAEAQNLLVELLEKVTANTQEPFVVPPDMSPSVFHTLYTGDNLRWEFIG
jgi:hypothetical protein